MKICRSFDRSFVCSFDRYDMIGLNSSIVSSEEEEVVVDDCGVSASCRIKVIGKSKKQNAMRYDLHYHI